uniref:Dynein regulatory complex subunit 7 n=1 Tax=Monopterus albus TaxID=43700 RepID=A0A3Q3JWM2_MONAL|nr:dynein regulatory complex subunit 7 [Monopterus albus]
METVLESDDEEQLGSGETLEEGHEEREGALSKDHVSGPHSDPQEPLLNMDEADVWYPESYMMNSADETRLLAIADNFQRQYSFLYPDRKPLLFCPVNECGVKKFVSTTIRPTSTSFSELFSWEGCASFVADFLSLEPLEPPTNLPRFLFSSTSVLQSQRATCFEFATLLCSLLLGAHYDAYCVSGYAVKEMCLLDQSLQECPLLDTESVMSEQKEQENKYSVKPQKELKSHSVMQEEKKKQDAEVASLQKQKLQEDSRQPPGDALRGLRVHCWVLVLSGSRCIQENFFIDPLTGNSYSTTSNNFLGIESVWNNLNYYVNMQDCRNGCTDMVFDLEDLEMWEPVLYSATTRKQLILGVLKKELKMMSKINDDSDEEDEEPCAVEMPRSWVSYITISKKDLENRWPGQQKVTRYRQAKLERFAAYLRADGVVARLTTYKDLDCTDIAMIKEWYQHRNDFLKEREVNKVDNFTTERFRHGRPFNLLFHRFTSSTSNTVHEMEFSSAHMDNLMRRVESPGEMIELFEGRSDFLNYRHSIFDQHKPLSRLDYLLNNHHIQKVVERFHRNKSKPANEDVAERVFLLSQRRIEVTYHVEEHGFIPSKRNFIKPQEVTYHVKGHGFFPSKTNFIKPQEPTVQAKAKKKKAKKDFTPHMVSRFQVQTAKDFTPHMVSSFQVDPSEKPLGTLTLHWMLGALMEDEEKVVLQIKVSKKEVRDIVACREQEEGDVQLLFSPWTTTGAVRVHKQRQDMERLAAEDQRWLQEKEKDILAPFMIRLDCEIISAENAKQLHRDCLAEFKQRVVDHANLIQERLEKETQELQNKQLWYQKHQLNMTAREEREYQRYCSEKALEIHVTKTRLSMHKEAAPQKYRVLDQKLKRDPRLAPHLLH